MLWRLGVISQTPEADIGLTQAIEKALVASQVGIDRFFFDWAGGTRRGTSPVDAVYADKGFDEFRDRISGYAPSRSHAHPYWHGAGPCSMHIEEVEAIWGRIAEADDWIPLENKVSQIRAMGEALAES